MAIDAEERESWKQHYDMRPGDFGYLEELDSIAKDDVAVLRQKEAGYKGSWKRRGGIGAFMMLARKWDRLEAAVYDRKYDIFDALQNDSTSHDNLMDDVRDLRRYLMLVEAEIVSNHRA